MGLHHQTLTHTSSVRCPTAYWLSLTKNVPLFKTVFDVVSLATGVVFSTFRSFFSALVIIEVSAQSSRYTNGCALDYDCDDLICIKCMAAHGYDFIVGGIMSTFDLNRG